MPPKNAGFTLIELLVILAILGILAVTALPRLQDQTLRERAFHDQALAALRYAQKAAVAQRRRVCVTVGANNVTLTIASAAGDTATCNTPLAGPGGGSPYTVTAPSGVGFSSPPASFSFFALGQASGSQILQVGGMASSIRVEAETGYVYDG